MIKINDEVFYTDTPVTRVSARDIRYLKAVAAGNKRKRTRLCVHVNEKERLHEMFIVHAGGAYVIPHKHPGKTESFHILEGLLKMVLFSDAGAVSERLQMGPMASGYPFFHRQPPAVYHMQVIESDFVVFHEVTTGPFDRGEFIAAPWAPAEEDHAGQERLLRSLDLFL